MERLIEKLEAYGKSDYYPFHMPGHKRRRMGTFPNPFLIDITEIDGFDNLHHAEGILKESMEKTAEIYGADQSFYLVNGSTCGILSAICGCTRRGGTILMARNAHKSAYHGAVINDLKSEYLYPHFLEKFGINGGISAEDVENALHENREIQAVFIVSPTYDGIVSDVKTIANICHKYEIPLIVDEAHGAHLPFADDEGGRFPKSALDCGADVVIQSLHKTLPSLTQTAILHIKGNLADAEKIKRYLGMFQTSSPSYVFMAAMEECVRFMDSEGRKEMKLFADRLETFYDSVKDLKVLKLLDRNVIKKVHAFDWDMSKIVISMRNTGLSGEWLSRELREHYHIEIEMSAPEYVVALSTLFDTEDGFFRLSEALKEIDEKLKINRTESVKKTDGDWEIPNAKQAIALGEALEREGVRSSIGDCENMVSQEFVYLYPPGIPILAPGEMITKPILEIIERYGERNMSVQGLSDPSVSTIITVAKA